MTILSRSHAKAISWPPSQYWDGADGDWSSFYIRVGSSYPEQVVRVLPSTAGQATWVVASEGCRPGERGDVASKTCSDSRGGLFNSSDSKSWQDVGNYSMSLELNLGHSDNATYGLDTVALGMSNATGGPPLDTQVVAAFANNHYYVGMFGLGQQGSNFSTYSTPNATFLSTLKERNVIPSLSWGYTAGAAYQSEGVLGSLTLGGYDSTRLVHNNVSFPLHSDVSRDLMVSLQSITANYENGSAISLLQEPIWTFIDSTIPYIYLPVDACEQFERTFGLEWNSTYERYFISETLHGNLVAENSTISFKLGSSKTGGPTVDINLPYSSFDLMMKYPLVPSRISGIRYFPLVRAANETQYTLGRVFLQEAYLITNYEQSNFSVFQSKYEDGVRPDIVAISVGSTQIHRSVAIKTGVSLGVLAFFVLILLAVFLAVKKRRRGRRSNGPYRAQHHEPRNPIGPQQQSVQEMAMNSLIGLHRELPDSGKFELLNMESPSGSGKEVLELSGSPEAVAHELPERISSAARQLMTEYSSKERPMTQRRNASDKCRIFVSTNMARESCTSIDTLSDIPCVETAISAYSAKAVYVNRSLTATPISESPQVSPVEISFRRKIQPKKASETFVRGSSAIKSLHGTTGRVFVHSHAISPQPEYSHMSNASMNIEIMIPPDIPEVKPLSFYKEDKSSHGNFF